VVDSVISDRQCYKIISLNLVKIIFFLKTYTPPISIPVFKIVPIDSQTVVSVQNQR